MSDDADVSDHRGVDIVLREAHRRWEWAVTQLQEGATPEGRSRGSGESIDAGEVLSRLQVDLETHLLARLQVVEPLIAGGAALPALRAVSQDASDAVASALRLAARGREPRPSTLHRVVASVRRLAALERDELVPLLDEILPPPERPAVRERFVEALERRPAVGAGGWTHRA